MKRKFLMSVAAVAVVAGAATRKASQRKGAWCEGDFRVADFDVKNANVDVARAQPHRPLCIRLRLLESTGGVFGEDTWRIERDVVRVDGKSGVGDGERPLFARNCRSRRQAVIEDRGRANRNLPLFAIPLLSPLSRRNRER